MSGRFRRVLFNGQTSDWKTIQSSVPQGSILGPLFFHIYIYINDLKEKLNSKVKVFTDDTSLFSEICDPLETADVLNNDLKKLANEPNNGKWFLTQVQLNKLRK